MTGRIVDLEAVPPRRPRVVTARDLIVRPRRPLDPFVATPDGRTVLLAAHTTLLVAGPSGVGKSLAASFDLAGRLARDSDSDWLGLHVHARRRVLLLAFEGAIEDNVDRVRALVDDDAQDRFVVWDEELGLDLPHNDEQGRRALVDVLRETRSDVVVIDTATAFFGSSFAVDKGEEAHATLEELRARSGQRFAAIVVAHTKKADRKGAQADPLEEISGTFPRKADAAVVLRRAGDEPDDPRRQVVFAKVRRGPEPRTKIATWPRDGDGPPRLELVGDAGRPVKQGTNAEAMAEWIARHDEPVAAGALSGRFSIGESTLRRRRDELAELGITHDRLPPGGDRGRRYAYGTQPQWRRVLGLPDEELGA